MPAFIAGRRGRGDLDKALAFLSRPGDEPPWAYEVSCRCDCLLQVLRNYFDRNPAGIVLSDVDCQISHETMRRPDLAIFVAGRLDGVDRKKIPLPFAPDIAVEVLAPSEIALGVN